MLKYCLRKWNQNSRLLKNALLADRSLSSCGYDHLVRQTVRYILNGDHRPGDCYQDPLWNYEKFTEIDHGDYQGTLLYAIPMDTYQPGDYEYLMTSVQYGSCSGCDTLQALQCSEPSEVIDRYMLLCKDLVTNMVHPFNCGWRSGELDEVVEMQ